MVVRGEHGPAVEVEDGAVRLEGARRDRIDVDLHARRRGNHPATDELGHEETEPEAKRGQRQA